MRRFFHNLVTIAALAACVGCVGLWAWSHGDTRFLRSDFFRGRFDGDRAWRGYYLATYSGQLAFEWERIEIATPPQTPPANRWSAEDAVGVRTPALRSFPFDGLLGFHFRCESVTGAGGTLRALRLALPLWVILVIALLPLAYRLQRWLRRRGAAGGEAP